MEIVTYPNKILREIAKKIKTPISREILDMVPEMIKMLHENNGMGLAAPQVGKSIRLCVIENEGKAYAFINPTITSRSTGKNVSEEGCLSFPGKFIPVERADKVQARYLDEKGNKCKIKAGGLFARCIQHEIDHLDGILFIDKKIKNGKRASIEKGRSKIESQK
jgi:peptide deformylase